MRFLLPLACCLVGCVPQAAVCLDPLLNHAIAAAQAESDRQAELAERGRVAMENAEIRKTGERLRLERRAATRTTTHYDAEPIDPYSPEQLDPAAITDAMRAVNVDACRGDAKGQVLVSVTVDHDGHVSALTVLRSPQPALGDCVAAAVRETTFPQTQRGGSFRYPFVLAASS